MPGKVVEDGSSRWHLLASAWPRPGSYGHLGDELLQDLSSQDIDKWTLFKAKVRSEVSDSSEGQLIEAELISS